MSIAGRFIIPATSALLIVGFLVLLGIVGSTVWLSQRAQEHFNQVIEARDIRSAAAELRNAVQSAESSQRGFLLTGNEIYLAPYDSAKTQAERQLRALEQHLSAHENRKASLARLTTLVMEKFSEIDQTVALKLDRKDAEALAMVRTNRGKALTDEANVFISGFVQAEDDRLTAAVDQQKANASMLRWVAIFGGLVIVLVVGGAAIVAQSYTRELAQTRDEVGNLNASLEKRVVERTADLAQANDEIKRFVHVVTHDLRAPLVSIAGFTRELEGSANGLRAYLDRPDMQSDPAAEARHAASVEMPEAIAYIRSSTQKMDNLITAIMKLSREGRRRLEPERVELRDLISASAAAIQHQVSEAGGKIELDLGVESVVTDRLSLEQIFGNLFDNASKYRSRSRKLQIDVLVRKAGNAVEFAITDNGRGIAPTDLDRVFDLFTRSGEQDQPGDGAGLAYVRTAVRHLGGEITVSSALDKGTTFRFALPEDIRLADTGTD